MAIYSYSNCYSDSITESIDYICDQLDNPGVLNEGIRFDIFIDSLKELISKDKRKFADKYYKIAMDSEDFANDVLKASSKTRFSVRHTLAEYTSYTVYDGAGYTTYTTYYDPVFIGYVIPDAILNLSSNGIIGLIYNLKNKYDSVLSRNPTIYKEIAKGTTVDCAKELSKLIVSYKKFMKEYMKTLDKMESALSKDYSTHDKKKAKSISKLLKYQKRIYIHDTRLITTMAQCVILQSNSLKKMLKKDGVIDS